MTDYVRARPAVDFKEEFDGWGVLLDPSSGAGFMLNPVGVFVWKLLDGRHSIESIIARIEEEFEQIPENIEHDIRELLRTMDGRGLIEFENGSE